MHPATAAQGNLAGITAAAAAAAAHQQQQQAYVQSQATAQQQLLLQQQEAWHGLLQAELLDFSPAGVAAVNAPGFVTHQQQGSGFYNAAQPSNSGHSQDLLAQAELAAAQQQQQLLLMAAAASDPAAAAALAALATGDAASARAGALHLQRHGCSQQ
jgi:hypothetical protein